MQYNKVYVGGKEVSTFDITPSVTEGRFLMINNPVSFPGRPLIGSEEFLNQMKEIGGGQIFILDK